MKKLYFILAIAIALSMSKDTSAAESVITELDPPSELLSSENIDKRIEVLQKIHLPAADNDNPRLWTLIEEINLILNHTNASFRLIIHTSKRSSLYWNLMREKKLADSDDADTKSVEARRKYLRTASVWEIITRLGENFASGRPIFYNDKIVFSVDEAVGQQQ